ncbi:hypothetical protein ACOTET_29715, partial [Achromobacter xylosoxidans]
ALWDEACKDSPQAPGWNRHIRFARALLSKLRATVSSIREGFELTYAADADDPACASDLSHFTNGWRACLMSQVRAPVADERKQSAVLKKARDALELTLATAQQFEKQASKGTGGRRGGPVFEKARAAIAAIDAALASAPVAELRLEWSAKALYDAIKDVLLNHRLSNLVDEDGEFFPLVDHLCSQDDKTTESGEFEIALICDAIYNDVLTKSAPVAGEAVYTLSVKGVFHNWKPTTAAFSIPDGEHQLFLSPAAPQASAEDEWKAAIRKFMDTAIPALAAIANVHTPDEIDALEAMPREPVIDQVRRLSQACEELSRQVRPERP